MRRTTLLLATLAVLVTQSSMAGAEQTVVDATVPIRARVRPPTGGRSGSLGRKLPLQVTVEANSADSRMNEIDFILTNTGNAALILPASPHPGDLEPSDPNVTYTVEVLSMYMTSGNDEATALPGGVELYGDRKLPETMTKLAPGESIRVLTRMTVPSGWHPGTAHKMLVGHVVLEAQTVKTSDGQTVEDTKELGSARSNPRTFDSLVKDRE
jgi:hypothetical protein